MHFEREVILENKKKKEEAREESCKKFDIILHSDCFKKQKYAYRYSIKNRYIKSGNFCHL